MITLSSKTAQVPHWGVAIRHFAPVLLALNCALLGCANSAQPDSAVDVNMDSRAANLAAAMPMPDAATFITQYFSWVDTRRARNVPAKLYLPKPNSIADQKLTGPRPVPLIVFSHGLGGSRDGYSYLGKYWASQGYASLHLQHVNSDRSIWSGNPLGLPGRMKAAAQDTEAINRVHDLSFALDQIFASEFAPRLDPLCIVAAGHSYGANTTLLASGAKVTRTLEGVAQTLYLREPRISAAIIISAPPFYGTNDLHAILDSVQIPTLHITATEDEINVPGYHSLPIDRIAVYEATGGASKTLAVFKDGSHSIFTDRLNTGGIELNPKVKIATRELTLTFFKQVFDHQTGPMTQWAAAQAPLLARFDRGR